MSDHGLTKQERSLVRVLRWWIFFFALATIAFIIVPEDLIILLNKIGADYIGWKGATLTPSTNRFWNILAVSMMLIILFVAIKAQLNIIKNITYVKIIILAKLATSIGFFISFIASQNVFAYLVGFLVDGLILLITWIAYRRALISRYIK